MLKYLKRLERKRRLENVGRFAVGTVSGLAIGSLVTLFTSKRSGEENRQLAKDKAEYAKDVIEKEVKKVTRKSK